jgi:hypothetical protein
MRYFKNTELAKLYAVSEGTVRRWIDATQRDKLDLQLFEHDGIFNIANIASNIQIIEEQVAQGKKHGNARWRKAITPTPEFYKLYDEKQIFDIITNLEIHHEIPRQYNYFDGGANHWDVYAERMALEETPNLVNSTIQLLDVNQGYIDKLLSPYKQVNIIDVGVGNAYPVKGVLERLIKQGKLGRYIALDISSSMLAIADSNIRKWFKDSVTFEGHEHDINYDRFSGLLVNECVKENAKDTINLVLLLGGTLSNMRYSDGGYRVVHDSMGINDLLIHTTKLDTKYTRRFFDFDIHPGETRLAPIHSLVVDLLNINSDLYDVEMGYDPESRQRFERIKFNFSLSIKFEFSAGVRIVELNRGDTVLVWRGLQQTADDVKEQLDRNDFYSLHTSQTEDQEYILTVSRVKRD